MLDFPHQLCLFYLERMKIRQVKFKEFLRFTLIFLKFSNYIKICILRALYYIKCRLLREFLISIKDWKAIPLVGSFVTSCRRKQGMVDTRILFPRCTFNCMSVLESYVGLHCKVTLRHFRRDRVQAINFIFLFLDIK